MNMSIKNRSEAAIQSSSISQRKQSHLDVCRRGSAVQVEGELGVGFDDLAFIHNALPEIDCNAISTQCCFLERVIEAPLFVSCMTGGSEEGLQANRDLAVAANRCGIPIGLGSFRVALEDETRCKDFAMREYAPDVPIMANIGAVQVREGCLESIADFVRAIDANALVIHLNCGQELFQVGGDRDFRGLKEAIFRAVREVSVPIIVKETGFGIRPGLVEELLLNGVDYIDVAGAGGTNWILVEEGCHPESDQSGRLFHSWGVSTPVILDALEAPSESILASGGIRSGLDLAKSLALGAAIGGMALPFIRRALEGGVDGATEAIQEVITTLHQVMLLTGSGSVEALRNQRLLKSRRFSDCVAQLIEAEKGR
ncbi:MAG: type 2 isopentenyl-diphosphate Delta-isomerase [Chlamydiia bacterium]|nr:type 2 isopentenyl-diphosphate Delta-isomerase [Chlamydiia bacterium]